MQTRTSAKNARYPSGMNLVPGAKMRYRQRDWKSLIPYFRGTTKGWKRRVRLDEFDGRGRV